MQINIPPATSRWFFCFYEPEQALYCDNSRRMPQSLTTRPVVHFRRKILSCLLGAFNSSIRKSTCLLCLSTSAFTLLHVVSGEFLKSISCLISDKRLRQCLIVPYTATNALDNLANIAKVQKWLRHANIATTRIYDHGKNN
ncbi:hypothetical protein SAMN05216302_103818 [Nitrosomonas aestuarii]|jgi:hypothetical protein|uniref:Uncharacterized protein n=1 Tax=Nitrosomonas aestuarii TaxID=52441 RepID=A0A1I4FJR3_9PROT|nr:hypothetical protein SAMN05216302_103818 [Nitrosomonas aestuarii]